mmetsp:Transcript_25212/g.40082  ORF Transcript_25212/g.40082 Transcript_25212/m.40082 type:complete len:159 (+) Transcript_25212:117-593(+)
MAEKEMKKEEKEDSNDDDLFKPNEDSQSNDELELDAEHNIGELNEYPKFTKFSPQILNAYTEIVKERIGPHNTTINQLRRELHLFGSVMGQFNHLLFEEVEQIKSDIQQIKHDIQEIKSTLVDMSDINGKLDQLLTAVHVSNPSSLKSTSQNNNDNNV